MTGSKARYLLEIGVEGLFAGEARLCGDMGYLHIGLADEKLLGIVDTIALIKVENEHPLCELIQEDLSFWLTHNRAEILILCTRYD